MRMSRIKQLRMMPGNAVDALDALRCLAKDFLNRTQKNY